MCYKQVPTKSPSNIFGEFENFNFLTIFFKVWRPLSVSFWKDISVQSWHYGRSESTLKALKISTQRLLRVSNYAKAKIDKTLVSRNFAALNFYVLQLSVRETFSLTGNYVSDDFHRYISFAPFAQYRLIKTVCSYLRALYLMLNNKSICQSWKQIPYVRASAGIWVYLASLRKSMD